MLKAENPFNVQTGPAVREDYSTISKHIEALEYSESLKKVYETLTQNIIDCKKMGNFKEDIIKIKAFVFDVDGVYTDGKITLMPDNQFLRTYHAKDSFATKYLIHKGYHVAIISGGQGDTLVNRFRNLGVKDIYINCFEKLNNLKIFMEKYSLGREQVLYMGDDIPDIPPMKHAGISVCPADASHEVRSISRYVSGYKGGEGCVRDIIEQVLRSQNNWVTDFDGKFITSA